MLRVVVLLVLLLFHVLFAHVALKSILTDSGFRNAIVMAIKQKLYVGDIRLAEQIETWPEVDLTSDDLCGVQKGQPRIAPGSGPPQGRVAILFMVREGLEEVEAWRQWLAPELDHVRRGGAPRISLYFHVSDIKDAHLSSCGGSASVQALMALPGARLVVPAVYTGWCELMAGEVALYRAALLDDPFLSLFVLLSHDSVPIVPLDRVLLALLESPGLKSRESPNELPSRMCPAGIRGFDVPRSCAYGIQPHWTRQLLLKHHQWTVLNRRHAQRLVDGNALRIASGFFQTWYSGEPLCSDEVFPLLVLAQPELYELKVRGRLRGNRTQTLSFHAVELYRAASRGIATFDRALERLGISAECVTYSPWPGCRPWVETEEFGDGAKSPVATSLSLPERSLLMQSMVERGLLFSRKLGIAGENASVHLERVHQWSAELPMVKPPPRMFPGTKANDKNMWWLLGIQWGRSSFEARFAVAHRIVGGCAIASFMAVAFMRLGGRRAIIAGLLLINLLIHFIDLTKTVLAIAEVSILDELRKAGLLPSLEL